MCIEQLSKEVDFIISIRVAFETIGLDRTTDIFDKLRQAQIKENEILRKPQ